jgi:hypothetical protein
MSDEKFIGLGKKNADSLVRWKIIIVGALNCI